MNRETRRLSDREGDGAGDGAITLADRPRSNVASAPRQRTTPAQFLREVRDELRQVAWPTRTEMVNYTAVVFFTLVLMITLIFFLNYGFGKAVLFMFQK